MNGWVTIIYKSGTKVHLESAGLTCTRRGSELVEIKYPNAKPRPLHIGLDEIESIWDGKV